jgi:hypothetical protein
MVLTHPAKTEAIGAVAALVMARAQKRLAEKTDHADLALHAIKLERRALAAIKLGLTDLSEVEKPAE